MPCGNNPLLSSGGIGIWVFVVSILPTIGITKKINGEQTQVTLT